jgi:hypothetical protein
MGSVAATTVARPRGLSTSARGDRDWRLALLLADLPSEKSKKSRRIVVFADEAEAVRDAMAGPFLGPRVVLMRVLIRRPSETSFVQLAPLARRSPSQPGCA